jgi:hypothetical protein
VRCHNPKLAAALFAFGLIVVCWSLILQQSDEFGEKAVAPFGGYGMEIEKRVHGGGSDQLTCDSLGPAILADHPFPARVASSFAFSSRAILSAMARFSMASAISHGPQPAAAIFCMSF